MQMSIVLLETWGLLEVAILLKGVLRSATTTSGVQSVMTHGVHLMPEWSVDSLDTLQQVWTHNGNIAGFKSTFIFTFQLPLLFHLQHLDRVLVQLCWMTSSAHLLRADLLTALPTSTTTVGTVKMLVFDVLHQLLVNYAKFLSIWCMVLHLMLCMVRLYNWRFEACWYWFFVNARKSWTV